jgi:VanZ family protein
VKNIKILLAPKRVLLVIALIWTGIVSYFCLINSNKVPTIEVPNLDKLIHVFFHFIFTIVWFLFFQKLFKSRNKIKPIVTAFLFSFVFGILIEILQQSITTTRSADVFDVFANSFGALLAILVILIFDKYTTFKIFQQ